MSVPSIFSQLYEQAGAFSNIVSNYLYGNPIRGSEEERITSLCLDLFELIFMFGSEVDAIHINQGDIQQLSQSPHPSHRLMASIIEEDLQHPCLCNIVDFYLFRWHDILIGGVSPMTIVYSNPNLRREFEQRNIEVRGFGGNSLFRDVAPLHQRGNQFKEFMYEYIHSFSLPTPLHDYISCSLRIDHDVLHPAPIAITSKYEVLKDSYGSPIYVNGIPLMHIPIQTEKYPFDVLYGRIAIARDFAVVLQENEWELTLIGRNPKFRQLNRSTRKRFTKLAAGFDGYMALADDGHIYVGPRAREFERGMDIEQLRDVVDVVGCEGHTVVLHSDSTVTCIDEPGGYEGPEAFAREVENWKDIIQVACGFDFIAGLKSDGSLVSVGRYYHCPNWKGIVQFDAFNCYYGQIYTIALLDNGSVVSDYSDEVSGWKDVVRVRVGNHRFAVGLKSDGTAYAIGYDDFVKNVQSWRDIVDIECKFNHAVAILSNGKIVSTGF